MGDELSFMAKLYLKDYLRISSERDGPYQDPSFTALLPNILAYLKFVMSAECWNIVKALKRMAWNKNTGKDSSELKIPIHRNSNFSEWSYKDFYSIYTQEYWQKKLTGAGMLLCSFASARYVSWASLSEESNANAEISPVDLEDMKRVVEGNIFNAGRLQGVSKDELMICVDLCCVDLFRPFKQYQQYIGRRI